MKRLAIVSWLAIAVAACEAGDPAHPKLKSLPATFLWGTATAPVQVEGGLHAGEWHQWESTEANRTGERADDGPNQFLYYDQDFARAEAMANNAHRLGIDFSRIFPTASSFPNNPDAAGVAYYHAVFASLKAHGLSPMVTLYHWNFPTWISDLTQKDVVRGWLDDSVIQKFGQFAGWAAREYGGEVDWWITLNEPNATILQGFITATFPPLRSSGDDNGIQNAMTAARNLIYAHAAAYDAVKAADTVDVDGDGKPSWVGFAGHLRAYEPNDPTSAEDVAATQRIRYLTNTIWPNAMVRGDLDGDFDESLDGPSDKRADPALANRLDYLGVNYYGPGRVLALGRSAIGPLTGLPQLSRIDDERPHTEFGWSIDASGFRTVLEEMKIYALPILITENGIADSTDAQRPRYLAEHIYVLQKAVQDGFDIRGYYHWSLIDNFEWAAGYCPRFGLIGIDFSAAQKPRTDRGSAKLYKEIIGARGVDPSVFSRYPSYPVPSLFCPGGG